MGVSACECVRARERGFAYTCLCINARINYAHIPTIRTSHTFFCNKLCIGLFHQKNFACHLPPLLQCACGRAAEQLRFIG